MKAGKAVSDTSQRAYESVSEGTKGLRSSNAAATTQSTVSNFSRQAAEGGNYLYKNLRDTTQGIAERFAGSAVAAASAREAKCGACLYIA
jgi:hypothetical protein